MLGNNDGSERGDTDTLSGATCLIRILHSRSRSVVYVCMGGRKGTVARV